MKHKTPENEFTPRQKEVIAHLIKGHSNKEIADLLFVTETCIRNHMGKILKKLGVKNRNEAILKAARNRQIIATLPQSAIEHIQNLPEYTLPIGRVRNG